MAARHDNLEVWLWARANGCAEYTHDESQEEDHCQPEQPFEED
jgi:hypothetical protein